MPEFVCRLGAPDGSVTEQRRVAASLEALRRELEAEGFHVFALARARSRIRVPLLSRAEKVSGQDFLLFNTQLKTLLHAGMPLAQSLDLLKDQQTSPHFRALLAKVHQQVTTGIALSDAFLALGDTFPRLYANSLKAGERTGELEQVIERFVEYQRLVEAVRRKIIGALTYPAVLVTLAIGLVIVLMTYVIPSFSDFYVQFQTDLPLPTRLVIGLASGIHRPLAAPAAARRPPVAPVRALPVQPLAGDPARRRHANGARARDRLDLGQQRLHRRALSRLRAGGPGGQAAVGRARGHRTRSRDGPGDGSRR